MPIKFTYMDQTISIIPHEHGKYICPLLPKQEGNAFPINHENWKKKGGSAAMSTSIGARLRYTFDRKGVSIKTPIASALLWSELTAKPMPWGSIARIFAMEMPSKTSTR
jgi:hypothetical protein